MERAETTPSIRRREDRFTRGCMRHKVTGTDQLPYADQTTEPTRAQRHLTGQYAVARVLAETASISEAAPGILEAACRSLDWQVGALWTVDRQADVLRCAGIWRAEHVRAEEFEARARDMTFGPGEGLPGSVWVGGASTWSSDVATNPTVLRSALAAEAGLHAAIAAPVSIDSLVIGVVELFSDETRPPDRELLDLMAAIGRQIGQFMRRQDAQEDLRRSQERLLNIMHSMPAAFYAMDFEFRLTFVNDAAETLMRKSSEELLGKVLWEEFPEALGTAFEEAQRKAMSERVHVGLEEYYEPFDSWLELHAYPFEDGLSVYVLDVTVRKRAAQALQEGEARTRAIVQSALDCVVTMDHEGRITEFNPAAERTFGYRHEEVIGRPLAETIVPPDLRDRHRRGLATYLRTGQGKVIGQRVELTAIRKDGSEFPVEVAITRVEGSVPPMFTGFIRDITNRKKGEQERARLLDAEHRARKELEQLTAELEQRVIERTAELEASNRELEAFSYSVSHDLRAPLRAIDGFSRIVVRDFGSGMPEQAHEYLGIVREGAQQMGRLIDDLLEFSKLGRQPLGRRDVDPRAVLEVAVEQLHLELEGRDVEIRVLDLSPCWADPSLLRQVYVNLLTNALKFTRTRPRAVIEVGSEEREGHHIYYVRDNGVGFDMRYADKLFGVFQRMHRAEDYEGTGVGLAIVQRIVHRHGGSIWADAEVDVGATFSFTLEERGDE